MYKFLHYCFLHLIQGWATQDRKFALLNDELDEAYGSDKYANFF